MYIPEPFKEDRIDVLHDAIRRAGLDREYGQASYRLSVDDHTARRQVEDEPEPTFRRSRRHRKWIGRRKQGGHRRLVRPPPP
jgi:hypothetical protein